FLREGHRVFVLAQDKFFDQACQFVKTHVTGDSKVLSGDVVNIDLGLSGTEVQEIVNEVTHIYHLAAIYHLGVSREVTYRVNVEGTKNILDFAESMQRLKRFVFFSSAYVSGRRTGVILEDDLSGAAGFHNEYERTKFLAEKIVRNYMDRIPACVMRPGIIVGDSKTGEIDRFDGPYLMINAILNMPLDFAIPLPGEGNSPLNLVPVDYVTEAAYLISLDDRSAGMTFHLTDPNPLPAKRVFEIVADLTGKRRPFGRIPSLTYRVMDKIPYLNKVIMPQIQFFEYFNLLSIYNCHNTLELLAGTGLCCPLFVTYAGNLLNFIKTKSSDMRKVSARKLASSESRDEEEETFY
ncbi:MAG: SDR family oxidoreductase, partial [Deltaproteobacteria bacterium]|nr:SDR family oxidoreductase [Deltaproteobacteria bacterium]